MVKCVLLICMVVGSIPGNDINCIGRYTQHCMYVHYCSIAELAKKLVAI